MRALKAKYKSKRSWHQATKSHGFWVYPHAYYDEMIDLILRG